MPKTNDIYNLGFGDFDFKTGEIDDKSVSNNGDIKKIMATVIQRLPLFFEMHPEKMVSFSGSDQRHTNFYKRIILGLPCKLIFRAKILQNQINFGFSNLQAKR